MIPSRALNRFFLLAILILNCGGSETGRFAFHTVEDLELNDIEKKYYTPKVFTVKKPPIYFYAEDYLWFCYYPPAPQYRNVYIVSLARKSTGWLDIQLKNQFLSPDHKALIGRFEELEAGEYRIRVSAGTKIIDQIEFDVLPPRQNAIINYDEPEPSLEAGIEAENRPYY